MKNIFAALDFLEQFINESTSVDRVGAGMTLEEARKEYEALQKAGISVSKTEVYAVEGPARKRGRRSK